MSKLTDFKHKADDYFRQWFYHHIEKRLEKYLGGHIHLGKNATLFGFNAMHVCLQIYTRKYGYICIHPPMYWAGRIWREYIYCSPNATPWACTWAIGAGVSQDNKLSAIARRKTYGHNFNDEDLSPTDDTPTRLKLM